MDKEEEYMEFRLVNDADMPPVVICPIDNVNDRPKIVMNIHHKLWLCLFRKQIAGSASALFEKLDDILTAYLSEQRREELWDRTEGEENEQ